jgi:hypothetical protein
LNESLRESGSGFNVPQSFFVFASHQGYEFMLLELRENDPDPPVWLYQEGEPNPVPKWTSFSEFLQSALDATLGPN